MADFTHADRAQQLRGDIHGLEGELQHLRAQLANLEAAVPAAAQASQASQASQADTTATPANAARAVDKNSSGAQKIALFRRLFAGRTDAYAKRWTSTRTGKSGWSPAVVGGFYTDATTDRDLLPLTDEVIAQHLTGSVSTGSPLTGSFRNGSDFHAGLYPMLPDDTCQLLVCDFDGSDFDGSDFDSNEPDEGGWRADAAAYASACDRSRIPCAVEISRSGAGAHVWIFFTQPIPASVARALGASLLRQAISTRDEISLSSYDRFFPSQDLLPTRAPGRFRLGNLIALPLQGACRKRNATVFADPTSWQIYDDQFAYLSTVEALTPADVEERVGRIGTMRVGPADTAGALTTPPLRRGGSRRPRLSGTVELRLAEMVSIPTAGLPASVIAELKHAASIPNPEFYRRQAQRFSTFGVPRLVTCFEHDTPENGANALRIPRGLADQASVLLSRTGLSVTRADAHPVAQAINLTFTGKLRPEQSKAVAHVLEHDTGVIAAEPGFGKTVTACAIIAARGVATAVLVNRAELASQWREQLSQHLGIAPDAIGQLGAGRRKRKGVVDIILLQSISHRTADPTILNEYGQIIVDECHSIGAPATEAAIRRVNARYWLGPTATPYRADKMDGLITMQRGPIRFSRMTSGGDAAHRLLVHKTEFQTDESGIGGASIQAIYTELVADTARNAQIVADVTAAFRAGRTCLVLSNRVDHVDVLASALRASIEPVHVLHGRMPRLERAETRAALAAASESPFVLVAIDKIAGEGLDLPALDTLFLAVPISFKGRVVQQLGRVTRGGDGASVVHDYRDAQVLMLERMHLKRRRVMQKQGFRVDALPAAPDV